MAYRICREFVPESLIKGQLGDETDDLGKESLLVYVVPRVQGITHPDLILALGFLEDAPENMACMVNFAPWSRMSSDTP